MTTKLTTPRGTADILFADIPAWNAIEIRSKEIFALHGYREVRTPVFEDVALFKRSLGETTEVVNKQLLEVKSQRADADDSVGLALRPEGTAPIVRMYNQNGLERHEGLSKFFYIGPMFRGERPQKGRLRQFHQIGAEAIGRNANNPFLDAEMIALSVGLLKAFGVEGSKLRINSLGSVEDKAYFATWLREALKDKISNLSDDCKSQYERNVFRLLDSKDKDCQALIRSLDIGTRHLSDVGRAYFDQVKTALDKMGVVYEVSPHLVRGLDYYTHTVFEISYAALGAQDAIGAGGRYNGLVEQLGGGGQSAVGAIGFALGMERILLALESQGKKNVAAPSVHVFVVNTSDDLESSAFAILSTLRQAGVSADMDFGKRAFKKQMEQAGKLGVAFALIVGDEFKSGQVILKDMKSGEQKVVSLEQVVSILKRAFASVCQI